MQRTSTYYKIRDVLDTASTHSGNIDDLAKALHQKALNTNSSPFVYFRHDAANNVREYPVAQDTIRRTIQFCIHLDLIQSEDQSVLTNDGQNALVSDGHFDLQLQRSVLDYLEKQNLDWNKIENAIKNLQLPHASALYQDLRPKDLSWDRFRTCFFLLSECGANSGQNRISTFQRKLYQLPTS